MAPQKPVRACMCHPHTFAELRIMAIRFNWQTTADITAAVGCGGGCGLCGPYLTRMLATGETDFDILRPEQNIGEQKAQEEGDRK